ncbi:hypothetical protein GCM10023314_30940 [Algibacter agarivorans]|uniref:Gliding motility-associated C-terminal domain-containing protein n=1 Tax=Algibacter agarivorans TaxID=1109741 RepID=A0ABP9GW23_9FLAO
MYIQFQKKYLYLVLFILIGNLGFSQLSKTHYIPPLTAAEFGNANPEDQYLYISTPSNSMVPYTIIPVGQTVANYITGTVSNTTPQTQSIGTGATQLFVNSNTTSTVFNNKGYIIEAEAPIYVSVRMNAGGGAQAGALVSKGLSALDTSFRIGTFTSENPQSNYLSFVSVMATEDDTQVTFDNLPSGFNIKNFSGTTPIIITLNEGESYIVAANILDNGPSVNNLMDGLIGSSVTSTKPIVVNCGSANGSFGNGGARDYGIDQIVGSSKIGNEYIFVRGNGNDDWENILVIPSSYPANVFVNGSLTPITITATDKYRVFEGDNYNANGNMYIETSVDAFVYQGIGSSSEANQGMFFVPPLSCETRGNIDNIPIIDFIGATDYSQESGVSIVTKQGAIITINNTALASLPSNVNVTGPTLVNGKSDYVTYRVTGLTGNVSVQGDDELYVAYFNVNGSATSGSFYSGFPSAPEINFDAQFATLGNCIPNVTLEAANAQNFDTYEWSYDDGSGFQSLATNIPSITPTIPARYKLIGTITCTGETLESVEIPVSLCPDDIDNDGIIDNIDIDNDNDGILNCTESRGDVTLDISNETNPILVFQDNSTNSLIASGAYTESSSSGNSNSLTGDNLGNFTSTVGNAASAEGNYTVNFTEPVNVKLTEHPSITNTAVNGDVFIVRIAPANKNITLVDPDNRLLIDSNFDGLFETGVTQMSGSEIQFRINPSPNGNTPFQFLANSVEGFSFVHTLQNITESSTFSANLSLTCFKQDNDTDGTKDELDFDSDNDGIPDFIENQGVLTILSNIDTDLNGLDDVYDITVSPIDSDNDGVLDFYDLDSDNDGIYDLIETGQLGTLSDIDLDGIEDGPTYGMNGWADAAETSPDSNIIGYTLNDLDNDTIFTYLDADSDGDGCSDVIEAGFSDANGDDFLGDNIVTTNTLGLVTNATDGYSLPNSDYLDFAPLTIATQPIDTEVCESSTGTIAVISPDAETYQWEVSTDGINWNMIVDDATYNGSQTTNLNITSIPLSFNTYQYRVKIDRIGNTCGLYSDEIDLTVNPLPIVTSPVILIQCDDNDLTTLGYSPFNLTEVNSEISTNSVNETFTYFLTQPAAISGDVASPDYISDPTIFENRTISSDAIWARIESQFGCASTSQIQLNVSTTVVPPTFVVTFNQCDDFLDIDGNDTVNNNDDRDGIATFDFSSVTATILGFIPSGQNPLPPRYYRNEADALAEINEITNTSNYRNIGYPNSQFIYIRVDSAIANDCLGLGAHILLNVEALPIAHTINIGRQCDDDADGEFPFDTSNLETDILSGQNSADVNISYFDSNGNTLLYADGTPVTSPIQPSFLTANQTITIRVTNNASAAPDGPCYDETTLEFIVDEQPITNPVPAQIVCDGDSGDITDDGFYPFDTSIFTETILSTQTNMEIYYDYIDENGNLITDSTTLPNPLISGNQTITVEVINPINTTCTANTNIQLTVNPLPEFILDEEILVCNAPFVPFDLVPIQTNPSEAFDYQWTFEDGTILGNNLILENISQPGKYTIALTNPTSLCVKSLSVNIRAADVANITLDDIKIVDLSENNTVTILNPSGLGNSTYMFSLVSDSGDLTFPYQENPVFNNVRAGFYTLFVQDNEATCDAVELNISVIGHPKFFTPNGDGYNDFWQIKGISTTNQVNSTVSIYDRYGKLLKQIRPSEQGWNGTFNGAVMPTDDYWFKVFLEDGRAFSGHFTLKR